MSLKKTRDPNVIKSVNGGGCLMLFGSPFFAAGLFMIAAAFGLVKIEGDGPQWVLFPFGLIFGGVGAGLMFGRSGVIIDRRARTVIKWWGLLAPFSKKRQALDDYSAVTIRKEIRRNKNSTTTIYPVRVEADKTAAEPMTVSSLTDFSKARAEAEQVAKFLDFPLQDHTSGKAVVREAGALDESLREKVRKSGEAIPLPDPPPGGLRSTVEHRLGDLVIEVPAPSPNLFDLVRLFPALIFAGSLFFIIFLPLTLDQKMDPTGKVLALTALGVLITIPILITATPVLRKLARRERVVVNRDVLRQQIKGFIRTTTLEIPTDQLEELNLATPQELSARLAQPSDQQEREQEYGVSTRSGAGSQTPGGQGAPAILKLLNRMGNFGHIQARSDAAVMTIAPGLPAEELKYLHALIKKTVSE